MTSDRGAPLNWSADSGVLWKVPLPGLGYLESDRVGRPRRLHQFRRAEPARSARDLPGPRSGRQLWHARLLGHRADLASRNQEQHGQPVAGHRRRAHLRVLRQRRRVLSRLRRTARLAAFAGRRIRRVREPLRGLQLAVVVRRHRHRAMRSLRRVVRAWRSTSSRARIAGRPIGPKFGCRGRRPWCRRRRRRRDELLLCSSEKIDALDPRSGAEAVDAARHGARVHSHAGRGQWDDLRDQRSQRHRASPFDRAGAATSPTRTSCGPAPAAIHTSPPRSSWASTTTWSTITESARVSTPPPARRCGASGWAATSPPRPSRPTGGSTSPTKPARRWSFAPTSERYEELARNSIDQPVFASPAISAGRIFLRSASHLWCFGGEK